MTANLNSYPVPDPGVVGRVVNDSGSQGAEAVLVLPSKGQVKVLNEVGARIWNLADGSRQVREIAAALCAEYQVEPDQAEKDVLEFLQDLESRGVIRFQGQPEAGG